MNVVGIIPARGGSKRLLRKNLCCVGNTPLVCLAIRQAQESGIFTNLFVSSDDEQIGKIANQYAGCDVWWNRPRHLAEDSTPMMPVVHDIYDAHPADVVMLLQPTTPFRSAEDIQKAYHLLVVTKADAVISVTDGPDNIALQIGWANRIRDVPHVLFENGAIYAITGSALDRGENWYSGLCYAYKMPKDRSIDIDTELDLRIARFIASDRCK